MGGARGESRGFWLLLTGYGVSSYGNFLNLIALGLFSYHLTGSSWATGVVMAVRLGAGFLAGLGAARVLGRIARRPLLIGLDLVQAAGMVALVVAPSLAMLLLVAVVLGVGNTTLVVVLRSGVPDLVGEEARGRANGRLVTARSLATILGFGSAGVVIDLGGYDAAFLLNGGSFLVSALALSFVRWPSPERRAPGEAKTADPVSAAGSPEADGLTRWRAVWRVLPALVVGMVVVRGLDALASAGHNVALPIFATGVAPENPAAVMTQFMTAWAIGSLCAHQLVSRLVTTIDHRVFAVATCVMSASFVLAFTGLPTGWLIAVSLLAGIADGVSEIGYVSTLQALPAAQRTRVFGLSASVENSAFGGGMVLSAGLLDVLPVLAVVGGLHGVAVAGVLAFLLLSQRRTPDGELVAHPRLAADPDRS
ncbi:major facilitator superfamily MFS_1 [Kribbella flavida DSM 17836]|uniref:Major facilitator superfamily MFS_1 n=1 Tax=Kribbella flavida (strain DSM 17836 / JCM 10339 / NBRC 14399) TaxID=479435 RepID=D2PWV8_KRIFD|nr:MFS transporter [Kribbella flavida]ADB35338.1 major facilitator superfamily MFS_1 [Kribbella flavida DSM 17836]